MSERNAKHILSGYYTAGRLLLTAIERYGRREGAASHGNAHTAARENGYTSALGRGPGTLAIEMATPYQLCKLALMDKGQRRGIGYSRNLVLFLRTRVEK